MIDAQSIVVASTATTAVEGEAAAPTGRSRSRILRSVFWHSLSLAALVGLFVYFQAKLTR